MPVSQNPGGSAFLLHDPLYVHDNKEYFKRSDKLGCSVFPSNGTFLLNHWSLSFYRYIIPDVAKNLRIDNNKSWRFSTNFCKLNWHNVAVLCFLMSVLSKYAEKIQLWSSWNNVHSSSDVNVYLPNFNMLLVRLF